MRLQSKALGVEGVGKDLAFLVYKLGEGGGVDGENLQDDTSDSGSWLHPSQSPDLVPRVYRLLC